MNTKIEPTIVRDLIAGYPMEKILVDEHAAARVLAVSVQTLRNDRTRGRGCPYVNLRKSGQSRGSIRYRMTDIQEWIKSHTIRPEVENG
jgi:hypothetical protein